MKNADSNTADQVVTELKEKMLTNHLVCPW